MFEFDPAKSATNLKDHGFSFEAAERFDWDRAVEARDVRRPYPEVRTVAAGFIGDRLCILVFTRRGSLIRVISLRKANDREARKYVQFHE